MLAKLTKQELAVVSNNSGMQRYLESLLLGKPATPRSWLYEQESADEVRDNWISILQRLEKGDTYEQNVFQFDTSQLAKWGPQGAVKPISELMDLVMSGFGSSPLPKAFATQKWERAKRAIRYRLVSEAQIRGLRPASYARVVDDMRARDTLESNSGWPLFTRRSKPEVKAASIQDAESGAWKDYPAIALFRNYNLKTRLVWMFPMSANIVEGSFLQVLQSAIINGLSDHPGLEFFAPWHGFQMVREMVTEAYRDSDSSLAASDFTATDEHFRLAATMEVYDVIKDCFQSQYRDRLRDTLVHMHTIPLVIGPDTKLVGQHGVSSGSNWTNFVETIFDWIVAEYVFSSMPFDNIRLSYRGFCAIGDDMAWVTDKFDVKFAQRLERLCEQVGQITKAEKTTNDRDKVKFLQRLFQRGYSTPQGYIRAVYPTIRALKSSVYPERFHDPRKWSSDMFCARQFMILENCVDHPLFEEFVRFVCAGQRDLIPFAKKTPAALDRIARETKLLPGLNPTYNQERRDQGLSSFASIRIAASL